MMGVFELIDENHSKVEYIADKQDEDQSNRGAIHIKSSQRTAVGDRNCLIDANNPA